MPMIKPITMPLIRLMVHTPPFTIRPLYFVAQRQPR
jgi:hypothetical protein